MQDTGNNQQDQPTSEKQPFTYVGNKHLKEAVTQSHIGL